MRQAQLVREGAFAEFDITTRRIDDTVRFTQLGGINTGNLFFHFSFNGLFHLVRQLGAVNGEELDAIVVERVMRRRDHNSRFRAEGARKVGNSRRWHWASKRG